MKILNINTYNGALILEHFSIPNHIPVSQACRMGGTNLLTRYSISDHTNSARNNEKNVVSDQNRFWSDTCMYMCKYTENNI